MEEQVHHYRLHIKDYVAATAHLNNEEDLAYRRLLDMYYDTEQEIPVETESVSRRLRVGLASVNQVLKEFFVLTEKGWYHARCDEEIKAYRDFSDKARANGKLGGRPKKTETKPNGNRTLTEPKPKSKLTSNQQPVTSNQEILVSTNVDKDKQVCPPCPIEEIISIYHETLPTSPQVRVRTPARDKQIKARWKQFYQEGDFKDSEGGVACFRWFFDQVRQSRFLTGQTDKPFFADLEWLTKASNFAKVVEGKYGNR